MNISTALLQEMIAFLTPLPCFQNEKTRAALLISSGLRDLLPDIENSVTAGVFVSLVANHLDQYGEVDGEPALLLLLRGVKEKVGTDKQAILQQFEERLKTKQLQEPLRDSLSQTYSANNPFIEKPIERDNAPRNMADCRYDVFLSYNTEERESVIQIARHLRDKAKLRPWFDQWHAIPGISVSENLKQGLETSETCAVFIGRSGEGPWQKSEIRKAIERQKQKSMLRVIPVLLPDAPDELDTSLFLLEYTWVDFRGKRLNDDDTLWRLECGIRGDVPGSGRPETPKDDQANQPQKQADTQTRPAISEISSAAKPEKRMPRWQLLGMLLLIITVGIGGWIMLSKLLPVLPIQKNTPTPTIAPTQKTVVTPTKRPEPTPTPTPTSAPLSVTSCWENETPGATCTEETTGMEFVYVPGGEFWMGCGEKEQGCNDDEKPRHQVRVNGFWMGKYEVTQAQWKKIMGNNPSRFKGADRPVEQVSWNETQKFLKKLNATVGATGQSPLQYRLPSEAEWEYAARAGTQTAYSFGEDPNQLGDYAWYGENSDQQTHPVGQKQPNAFGLYDMHGNVSEWVADTYHENYDGAPNDESLWGNLDDKKMKAVRGGSWSGYVINCRSTARDCNLSDNQSYQLGSLGFRVVVGIPF